MLNFNQIKMISDNVTDHNNKIVDLEVHMRLDKENECPYLIKYYGALHANVRHIFSFYLINFFNSSCLKNSALYSLLF